jgi:hypothetical protein
MSKAGDVCFTVGGLVLLSDWNSAAYHFKEAKQAKSWSFGKVVHIGVAVAECVPALSLIMGVFDRIVRALIGYFAKKN